MKKKSLNQTAEISNTRIYFLVIMMLITSTVLKAVGFIVSSADQIGTDVTKPANSLVDCNLLPDGTPFAFWDDITKYTKVLHVAQKNPRASDVNPGTLERPLKTINAAAQLLQPGEKVIVHEGIYRECIRPARGGTSPNNMIAYEVAKGEKVIVKGSEIWKPKFLPSSGYLLRGPRIPTTVIPTTDDIKIWMADIPEDFFKSYNPFTIRNVYRYISTWGRPGDSEWMNRALLYRGALYVDGKPLKQVLGAGELSRNENAFWVEEPGLRLHLSLSKDIDPSTLSFEVTAREQIFAPRDFGLAYIRITGFAFEHAANGPPVPQRASVSTMRGHHWIIENNRIEWANGIGLDLGSQAFDAEQMKIGGGHIVRNNVIRNIGMCGIAGLGLDHTLVEKTLIENIGYLDLESNAEAAGLKFHGCHNTMVRQNIFRHISHASGLWFDVSATNCRIVNNVFADIKSINGGISMEIHFDPNLIDHNIFWDIQDDEIEKTPPPPTNWSYGNGTAIRSDCNDKLIIAHNLFGKIKKHAVSLNTLQYQRIVEGRTGIGYANKVVNNIFFDCPNRIYLAEKLENFIDGNLYDIKNERGSFLLVFPEPYTFQNLAGWQELFGFDKHSTQAKLNVTFDLETCVLEISIEGKLPECQYLTTIMNGKITSEFPGPFTADQAQKSQQIIKIGQKFPIESE